MTISRKITLATLGHCKPSGTKFSVLTCYDARSATLMEQAGVEVLLVGDSAGEVILGLPSTREIPAEFLLTLTAAVRRGAPNTLLMGDLPYACRSTPDSITTINWCKRFIEEAGCDTIKIEVTSQEAPLVSAATDAGIPVIAHLGLLPQMVDPLTGRRAQGKDAESARQLIEDAKRMENAGAVGLLLEAVASEVAREITTHTDLPVIGCCSGPHCDGTVVVVHDILGMVGMGGGRAPRSVKRYAEMPEVLTRAFTEYVEDIHAGRFPTDEQAIHMKPGEMEKLLTIIGEA